MKIKKHFFLALSILQVCILANAQPAGKCTVKLQVKEKKTGSPISDASIQENKKTLGKTNYLGVAYLPGRDPGFVVYTIIRNGYIPRDIDVTITPDTTNAPSVLMNSEKTLEDELAAEMKKEKPDLGKAIEIFNTLNKSYEINGNKQGQKNLLKIAKNIEMYQKRQPA